MLLQLGAELQGEDVRARVLHAEPLDVAAAKTQKGLRIFVKDTKSLDSIAKRLLPPAANRLAVATSRSYCEAGLQTEVEFKLEGRFQVSPEIARRYQGGLGVEMVETLRVAAAAVVGVGAKSAANGRI